MLCEYVAPGSIVIRHQEEDKFNNNKEADASPKFCLQIIQL